MGESNDLFIENVLLKNIDEYIPINIDLSTIPEKKILHPQWEEYQQQSQKPKGISIRCMTRQWEVNWERRLW